MAEKKTNKLTGAKKEAAKKVFGKGKTLGDLVKKTVSKYKQGTKAQSKKVADKKTATKKQVNTQKTSVVRNTVGKMSPDDKVAPKMLGRANPQPKRKSTADKTSVVNRATTGMKSEKTGPDMSRGTPKRGNVQKGAETYNKGSSMLKSNESASASAQRRKEGMATVKKKRKGPSGPTMTSFK